MVAGPGGKEASGVRAEEGAKKGCGGVKSGRTSITRE